MPIVFIIVLLNADKKRLLCLCFLKFKISYYLKNMIQAHNIHKSYGELKVLMGISVEIKKAEVVTLTGPSGAGKSTLLQILGTLDNADSGEVIIGEQRISQLKDKKLANFRNTHIGFIFQFHHLLPEFTALENVCLPALIAGKQMNTSEKRALELLDYLHLSTRAKHKPSELSGGEQQRVAVARALMNQPDVIFADEPSGNLDSISAKELHELFFKLRNDFEQTFVIVTHNESFANMADRRLYMKDGLLV